MTNIPAIMERLGIVKPTYAKSGIVVGFFSYHELTRIVEEAVKRDRNELATWFCNNWHGRDADEIAAAIRARGEQ